MKKGLMALALALVMLMLTGCGIASSNQELYERAQLYLGGNDYEAAAALFMQLGEFGDSADYALYAKSLLAWQDGDLTLARHGLEALHPFKSTGRYLAYLDALDAEHAGDTADALARYEALGTFGDSPTRAQILREKLKEEQAEEAPDPENEERAETNGDPEDEEAPESEATILPEELPEATEAPLSTETPAESTLSPLLQGQKLRNQLSILAQKELERRHAQTVPATLAPEETASPRP